MRAPALAEGLAGPDGNQRDDRLVPHIRPVEMDGPRIPCRTYRRDLVKSKAIQKEKAHAGECRIATTWDFSPGLFRQNWKAHGRTASGYAANSSLAKRRT